MVMLFYDIASATILDSSYRGQFIHIYSIYTTDYASISLLSLVEVLSNAMNLFTYS